VGKAIVMLRLRAVKIGMCVSKRVSQKDSKDNYRGSPLASHESQGTIRGSENVEKREKRRYSENSQGQ